MVQRVNVRLSGRIGTGAPEVWSVGLNYGINVTLSQEEAQEAAELILSGLSATSWAALGTLKNGVGASVTLNQIDTYSYGPTGPAVGHGVAAPATPFSFTGTTSAPPQVAACITLLTGQPGRSRRGRIYWPQTAPAMGADMKSSTAKDKSTGMVTTLAAINNALLTFGTPFPAVYSPTLDVVTPVTAVRAGDVLDTQRRRRDALAETFTTSQYPGS